MTGDEAKTKWCPFARVGDDLHAATNRPNSAGYDCIASDCMAWRKSTVFIDRATGEPAVPGNTPIGSLELRYSGEGFCGLAGAPQ